MTARPQWRLPAPDPRPGCYFTSAIYGRRSALLTGPFPTHREALADVNRAKALALSSGDPKADFAAYGTCHVEHGPKPPRAIFRPEDSPYA